METGWPSAPLSRGPDGPTVDIQGTVLNVAPVSTKYLSFVNSFVRKMRPAFAGKCMAVAVACVEFATKQVRVWRHFSFPNRSRGKCTCVLWCVKKQKKRQPKKLQGNAFRKKQGTGKPP